MGLEYGQGQSGEGEEWMGYKVWWTGRVMGYGGGVRGREIPSVVRTHGSVEEGNRGAPGESIIPEFQSPAAPGANQRQLEADSTSYSYL